MSCAVTAQFCVLCSHICKKIKSLSRDASHILRVSLIKIASPMHTTSGFMEKLHILAF